jgi:hypothetical protein
VLGAAGNAQRVNLDANRRRLVKLYEAWGKPDQAARCAAAATDAR